MIIWFVGICNGILLSRKEMMKANVKGELKSPHRLNVGHECEILCG